MDGIRYGDFVRVQKQKARSLHKAGKTIYVLPSNIRLGNAWIQPCEIPAYGEEDNEFDKFCNAYTYYNCNNECGKYIHFYIRTEG